MSYAVSTVDDLTSYLTHHGWEIASAGSMGALWRRGAEEGALVAVPSNITSRNDEWSGIVNRIAQAEKLKPSAVDTSIKHQYIDSTEFRAADDVYIEGSIPLEAGFSLFASARTMVRVCATTSRGAKARIGGGYSTRGDRIAETARFGHTLHGSYIIPVFMPLPRPTESSQTPLGFEKNQRTFYESEERRVTRTMAQSLAALKSLVVEPGKAPRKSVVADLVTAGVSREMVLAVHRVISDESVATFDASFSWAGSIPQPPNLPEHIVIPSESAELLEGAARQMKVSKRTDIETMTGLIVQLRDEGDGLGDVVVQTVRRGRPCEITVRLGDRQLIEAHEWFKERRALVLDGPVVANPGRPLRVDAVKRLQPLDETFLPLQI
jgi:hypothetical protein